MGWNPFKSKTQVSVSASAVRLIENSQVPDAVTTGLLDAMFNDGDPSEYVPEALVSSLGTRAEYMYEYGRTKYSYGLPSGQFKDQSEMRRLVQQQLDQIHGAPVILDYCEMGSPNYLHMGWLQLTQDWGWDSSTNQIAVLSQQTGRPVYLKDMRVVIPQSETAARDQPSFEQWGTAPIAGYTPQRPLNQTNGESHFFTGLGSYSQHQPLLVSAHDTQTHVRVEYVWQTVDASNKTVTHESTLTLAVPGSEYAMDAFYFQAQYRLNGKAKFWMYQAGSGTYPVLDNFYEAPAQQAGTYFPLVHFRQSKTWLHQDKTSLAYKTSAKLLKKAGMDYDALLNAIASNPGAGDIEQAFMMLAVPAESTDPAECRYLFDYFDSVYLANQDRLGPAARQFANIFNRLSFSIATVIQDPRFKMVLSNNGMAKRRIAGSIGKVGTYTANRQNIDYSLPLVDDDTGTSLNQGFGRAVHFYRHQITETVYEEIAVVGLSMAYYIYGDYTSVGEGSNSLLLIPIDHAISGDYSSAVREQLYARAFHFIFTSLQITKVKWYQTGAFATFLTIVGIAVAIFDGGATLGVALGLSGASAIAATIIIMEIVGRFILPEVFKIFVKAAGVDVAKVLAVVAVIYGGYRLIQVGLKAGTSFAQAMLMVASNLQSAVMRLQFEDLMGQAKEFRALAEEKTKLLETSTELLENITVLSPMVVFGESPKDFYNRTVHSGNIGVLTFSAISSYVDIALTLPKLDDTIGEAVYG